MSKMKNPAHPGKCLKIAYLEPKGISREDAAKVFNLSLEELDDLLDGKKSIDLVLATNIANYFQSTPQFWLRLQAAYDVAQTRM
ncbi:HigA family addiction module antidote protein [Cardiobacteriaceae bacterium TAE3-ERU3]|nr:HigA family addiction module antidote protein [Cardiobacteriaceae bacterium TAE3-ERU3]